MIKNHRASIRTGFSLVMGMTLMGLVAPAVPAVAASPKAAFSWTVNLSTYQPAAPNYLYPYMDGSHFTQSNSVMQLQMYRPLYWFGTSTGAVAPNYAESVANIPVLSNGNKTATITMKPNLVWSNGASVQAKDVVEWLNVMAAMPDYWGNYSPPVNGVATTVPDILKNVTVVSKFVLKLDFNSAVNLTWLVNNPLSNISPLPQSFDIIPANWTATGTTHITNPTSKTAVSNAGGNFATTSAGCWSTSYIGNGNTGGPGSTGHDAIVDPAGGATVVANANAAQAFKCQEVFYTMRSFALDVQNWSDTTTDTGKLFSVTDGAFKLKSFDSATSARVMTKSASYTGPRSATSPTELNYQPCFNVTGDCQTLLQQGLVDIGSVPSSVMHPITNLSQAATAPINISVPRTMKRVITYSWSIGFSWMNWASTNPNDGNPATKNGDILKQSYIRVVLNDSYPVTSVINNAHSGYAYSTFGPIPPFPANNYSTVHTNPFKASAIPGIMTAHGWAKVSGVWTCRSGGTGSGHCGAGINAGATMNFGMDSATAGDNIGQAADNAWVGAAQAAGITLNISIQTFDTVTGNDVAGAHGWDISTGSGWVFAPGFLPTGDPLFLTGAGSNAGSYSVPSMDDDILGTLNGSVALDKYARDYLANPAAVGNIWTVGVTLYSKHIGGYQPQASGYTPVELWHYVA
jgi:peptide/nickel transport system substrate-binding protein